MLLQSDDSDSLIPTSHQAAVFDKTSSHSDSNPVKTCSNQESNSRVVKMVLTPDIVKHWPIAGYD